MKSITETFILGLMSVGMVLWTLSFLVVNNEPMRQGIKILVR